jgi:hypothetical protein
MARRIFSIVRPFLDGRTLTETALWTIQAELMAAMWDFARKNWKTNIAFQGGRTTGPPLNWKFDRALGRLISVITTVD